MQGIKIKNNEALDRTIIPVKRRCHSAGRCIECTKKEKQLQFIQKEQEELKRRTEEQLKAMMQEINKLKVQMSELRKKNKEANLGPTMTPLDHLRRVPPTSQRTQYKNTRISPDPEQVLQSGEVQKRRNKKLQRGNTDNGKDAQKSNDDRSRKRKPESMVETPDAMTFEEFKREVDERRRIKNSIVIKGDFNPDWKDSNNMSHWLNAEFGINKESTKIKKVVTSQKSLLTTLESINPKKVIIAQKSKLKGSNLWINDDYTRREAHVQAWIRQEVDKEFSQGRVAKTNYMRMWAKGTWWR